MSESSEVQETSQENIVPTVEQLAQERKERYQSIVKSNVDGGITHVTIEGQAERDHNLLTRIHEAYGKVPKLGANDELVEWSEAFTRARAVENIKDNQGAMGVGDTSLTRVEGVNTFILPNGDKRDSFKTVIYVKR